MEHRRIPRTLTAAALAATLALAAAACGDSGNDNSSATGSTSSTSSSTTNKAGGGTTTSTAYKPSVDPASFVHDIDNPYFPLLPGTKWVYDGMDNGNPEHDVMVVTDTRKMVDGISAVVVHDTVSRPDGTVVEDTDDWYAQDKAGNVWYLGEDTKEYENGQVSSTAGSWEAGVDGAQPGIVMPAHPRVGASYRQEYRKGEAEDQATILRLDANASTKVGDYGNVLVTRETTRLEPNLVEEKYYASGIGLIEERVVQGGSGTTTITSYTPPA